MKGDWNCRCRNRISRTIGLSLLIFGLTCAILSEVGVAEEHSGPSQQELTNRLDAHLEPYVAGHDFSGVVLIGNENEILFRKAYGMANLELGVPNQANTKFEIASVTKTFTAAAIVMLKERGLLAYEDRLSKFLPDYPRGEKISVRHLLGHASGVPNPDYENPNYCHRKLTLDEVIETFKHKPLHFEPGTDDRYSNGGYVLLARIVERVSGQSYADFLRGQIFAPLGMGDTANFDRTMIVPNRACGYLPGPGQVGLENAPAENLSLSTGSGSLYSTADDLLRWARAVCSNRLFDRNALKYPYGWGRRNQYGHRYIEQSGISTGFMSHLIVILDQPVFIVWLSNTQSGLFGRVEKGLIAIATGGDPDKTVKFPNPTVVNPLLLKYCPGRFQGPNGLVLRVVESNGNLYAKFDDGPVRLYLTPVSESEFFLRSEFASIVATKDRMGQVTQLLFQPQRGQPFKLTRLPPDSTR
jgi:CubicO group peptidase (beta-lactamase class C family)